MCVMYMWVAKYCDLPLVQGLKGLVQGPETLIQGLEPLQSVIQGPLIQGSELLIQGLKQPLIQGPLIQGSELLIQGLKQPLIQVVFTVIRTLLKSPMVPALQPSIILLMYFLVKSSSFFCVQFYSFSRHNLLSHSPPNSLLRNRVHQRYIPGDASHPPKKWRRPSTFGQNTHSVRYVAFLRSCSFSLWFLEQLAKKQAVDIGVTSNKVFIQQLLAPLLGRVVEGYRLMERTLPKGF